MKTILKQKIILPRLKINFTKFINDKLGYQKFYNSYKKDVSNGRFHMYVIDKNIIEIHFDIYLNNGNHFVLPSETILQNEFAFIKKQISKYKQPVQDVFNTKTKLKENTVTQKGNQQVLYFNKDKFDGKKKLYHPKQLIGLQKRQNEIIEPVKITIYQRFKKFIHSFITKNLHK